MSKKRFRVNILSPDSIKQLQDDLLSYEKELSNKCRLLAEKLAEDGINVAKAKINESALGHYITLQTDISAEKMGTRAIILATGEVKKSDEYADFNILLAVEFGAGVYYNSTPNPNAGELGLGVGTFPGQIHAFENGWYYWDEEAQEWKYTHGIKATMPMYEAFKEIYEKIVKRAKEVFA